jgi:two-component system cell cycle sensor histidine kinase/response regulator CckA
MANRTPSRVTSLAEHFFFHSERSPQPPRTVLVVDDEDGIRRFINRVLENAGYATVVAANGPEAERIAAGIPSLDLIVTDVMMPEMSGCELARRLRLKNPDLKVLYVTGYSDRLFEEKVMMWENEAFVEKPCSVKALLEAVSLLWSQRIETQMIPPTADGGYGTRLAS